MRPGNLSSSQAVFQPGQSRSRMPCKQLGDSPAPMGTSAGRDREPPQKPQGRGSSLEPSPRGPPLLRAQEAQTSEQQRAADGQPQNSHFWPLPGPLL